MEKTVKKMKRKTGLRTMTGGELADFVAQGATGYWRAGRSSGISRFQGRESFRIYRGGRCSGVEACRTSGCS